MEETKLNNTVKLVKNAIPEPSEKAKKFKTRKCTRCNRDFHPVVGTQPTCCSCYYLIKCTYCGQWYKPKPARITRIEQTKGNHFCCKKHGDSYKANKINGKKSKAIKELKLKAKHSKIIKSIKVNKNLNLICLEIPDVKNVFSKKNCLRCNREYYPIMHRQYFCNFCYYETTCSLCGKILKPSFRKDIKNISQFYCRRCSSINVMNKNWENEEFKERILSTLIKGTEIKYCNSCNKETAHVGKRCRNCDPWVYGNPGFKLKKCNNKNSDHFGVKVLHIGNRCFKCNPWKISSGRASFNREKFYSSKFDLIDFESVNKKISWENLDPLNGVPGVWAVWSVDNKCLDVCQTNNIGVEMRGWIRNYFACKGKTDEELIEMNRKYQNYNRKKKRDIAKYCSDLNSKPIFKVVVTDIINKDHREAIEAQYAHDNKSLFWNPAPGQSLNIENSF